MKQMLLTDEEIMKTLAFRKAGMLMGQAMGDTEGDKPLYQARYIAKAQLKRVAGWGMEWCQAGFHNDNEMWPIHRYQCEDCWQALLEEIK